MFLPQHRADQGEGGGKDNLLFHILETFLFLQAAKLVWRHQTTSAKGILGALLGWAGWSLMFPAAAPVSCAQQC